MGTKNTKLADQVMAACAQPRRGVLGPPECDVATAEWLQDKMRRARRYEIFDDVTQVAARIRITHPSILRRELTSARAPFDITWLEYSPKAAIEEVREVRLGVEPAAKIGCFIERLGGPKNMHRVTMVGIEDGQVAMLPFSYLFSPTNALDQEERASEKKISALTDMSVDLLGATMIGPGFRAEDNSIFNNCTVVEDDMPDLVNTEEAFDIAVEASRDILTHACFDWAPAIGPVHHRLLESTNSTRKAAAYESFRTLIGQFVGAWSLVVSILALINDHEIVNSGAPSKTGPRRFVGSRVVPYLDTYPITLRLTSKDVVRRIVREMTSRLPPRLHSVAGHWNTSRRRGDLNCDHAWIPLTEARQLCGLCDGLRWWKDDHERGDAALGRVEKDRRVKG